VRRCYALSGRPTTRVSSCASTGAPWPCTLLAEHARWHTQSCFGRLLIVHTRPFRRYTLTDHKRPLHERLATFEGNVRHVTSTFSVNHHLTAAVERTNRMLAETLNESLRGSKVWQLHCTYKPAADGAVYLVWCSSHATVPVDPQGHLEADWGEHLQRHAAAMSSTASRRFQTPSTMRNGVRVPVDGSCFHMPLPGMTSFDEPGWWHDDAAISCGVTTLLPSPTQPPRSQSLDHVWNPGMVQRQALHVAEDGDGGDGAASVSAPLSARHSHHLSPRQHAEGKQPKRKGRSSDELSQPSPREGERARPQPNSPHHETVPSRALAPEPARESTAPQDASEPAVFLACADAADVTRAAPPLALPALPPAVLAAASPRDDAVGMPRSMARAARSYRNANMHASPISPKTEPQ
jgi:hypothetical protein